MNNTINMWVKSFQVIVKGLKAAKRLLGKPLIILIWWKLKLNLIIIELNFCKRYVIPLRVN